ncbi:zinc finger BED domain-containing protein 4-like [Lucilia sericata]|uniref:zinc finger BED domain-containing protein 4-like n=1 Tax=Lucilia sericata TaxID=13632 RepID=UPI0018A7ED30|nr:zinc finger BED domain-containing protein 4-like [Lucilia sericata]
MVLCKLYQRGCCYRGSNCLSEHVDVKDIIEKDMREAVNGKIWPLSAYGPFEYKQSLPNFIEDQSFEEVRMSFYETKLKNFFGQNHDKYNKDVQEARNKMKPTVDVVNVAINLYDIPVGRKEKNTSPIKCSSAATVPNTSFNNPFGVKHLANDNTGLSTTNNNNNTFGLPNFTSTMQTTDVDKHNTLRKENSASTISKPVPLLKQRLSSININPPPMVKSATTNCKPIPLNNLNDNKLLGKETLNNSDPYNIFGNTKNSSDPYNIFGNAENPGTANTIGVPFKPFAHDNSNNNLENVNSKTDSSTTNSFAEENVFHFSNNIFAIKTPKSAPSGIANSFGATVEPFANANTNSILGNVNSKTDSSTTNSFVKENKASANSNNIFGITTPKSVASNTKSLFGNNAKNTSGIANSVGVTFKPDPSNNLDKPFGKEHFKPISSKTNSVFGNNTENASVGATFNPVPSNNISFLGKETLTSANSDKSVSIGNKKSITPDIENSVSRSFKPIPTNNFNSIWGKETLDSSNSKNPFGIENVIGAKPKSHNTNNQSPGIFNTKNLLGNKNITGFKFGVLTNSLNNNETNQSASIALPNSTNVCFTPSCYTEQGFWPDDDNKAKQIDKSLMDLILVDMLPCSIVNGMAFQRLKFADPTTKSRYKHKSELFFSTTLRPETYNNVRGKILTMMATPTWISLTIDNWSFANNSKLLLLTFTAHFLHGSLRKKLVLAAKVLENDQKDSYITEKLPEIIQNFKLEEKLHLTVCDKLHNIEITKITEFECVAHTMQLAVYDAIFNKEHVEEILTKCRKIAKHFEKTQQASEYFQTLQEKCLLEKECLIQDVETNWCITYLMMKRFMEQKMAISLYSKEKGDIENLTTEEWDYLKNIVEALKSIYEATTDLSADTATISLIIPLIKILESKLNEADNADQLQNDLKHALNERFKFIETSPLLIMSTLLDPRFKNKYLSITQMTIAEKEISNFLQMDTANSSQTCNKGDKHESNDTLWEKHDVTIETDISFRNELSLYIHEPLSLRKSNIFVYWNTSRYVKLKKLAEKYISVPPTIKASEQMLEAAGRLYTERKAYLKEVDIEELLYFHFNIPLLEFDY